jgi:hypothetical protein
VVNDQCLFDPPSGLLTIYHSGIKDFELLFPHVTDSSLRARIGVFAEQASNCFQSKSWVSYCLIVGGVLEGLLHYRFGNKFFSELIDEAKKSKILIGFASGELNGYQV